MKKQGKIKLAIDVIGVMVSRAIFMGMNPVGIGFFGAAYAIKQGRVVTFLMMSLGMATVLSPVEAVKYMIAMGVSMIINGLVESKSKKVNVHIIAITIGLVTTCISASTAFYYNQVKDQLLLCALEGVIAFCCVYLFHKGTQWMLESKHNCIPDNEQLISTALMFAAVIYSLQGIELWDHSIGFIVGGFITVLFAYKYGAAYGAVQGTICGVVLGIVEQQPYMTILMCILGVGIGAMRNMGRILSMIVFLTLLFGTRIYATTYVLQQEQIEGLIVVALLFLCLPPSLVQRVDAVVSHLERNGRFAKENIEAITQHKLQEFSKSFYQLSKTFRDITQKRTSLSKIGVATILEDMSTQVCTNCEKCDLCWKQNYKETYQTFQSFLNVIEDTGSSDSVTIPYEFQKRCDHVVYLMNEGVRIFETEKLNYAWQNRLAESREAIAGQLDEVACIIDEFSSDLYRTSMVSDEIETGLKTILKANRLNVSQLVVLERKDQKKQVYMIAKAGKGQCITSKEVAGIIGSVMNLPMKPTEATKNVISKTYDTFAFVEDTTFKALTGSARITKQGEKISGDSFSILNLENGQMILSLSDGMGTGVNANEESESVIELLEQFMEAGFKEESAIRLINSILVLKSEQQSFSTIDLSILNMYTGVCDFVKIGAATTFIKRDQWVETISSTTMPVGVFNQVDFDQKSKKLYDGDYIIMMSDGVLDCIPGNNKEKIMQEIILSLTTNNPQELANRILKEALAHNEEVPVDDMTVLVAGIWKK